MTYVERMLKVFIVGFALHPKEILAEIGQRLRRQGGSNAQVQRLRSMTREAPLLLRIETINVCNAACSFCSYTAMKRKKRVMSMALFEKVVKDYADMGGGPVTLTPLQGDALLDPHLLERIRILEANPKINQITLTTNAIALERYSDDDIRYLLKALDVIQLSIGGLDAETYKTVYAVDRYEKVRQSMERLLELKQSVPQHAAIAFAFRTNDWRFELRFRRQIKELRQRGVFVSHLWAYSNLSGLVKSDKERNLVVADGPSKLEGACIHPSVNMAVLSDGTVTACGCADIEGSGLMLGHVEKDSLSAMWSGAKRKGLLDSFEKGKPPAMCRRCASYEPDSIFSYEFFKDAKPHQPLSRTFFHLWWGG
jgi:MoaA/NifB/PqqE/SkfB family radical SAM enzyme